MKMMNKSLLINYLICFNFYMELFYFRDLKCFPIVIREYMSILLINSSFYYF